MITKTGRENRDSGKVGATPSISSHPGPELISFDGHFGGTQVLTLQCSVKVPIDLPLASLVV